MNSNIKDIDSYLTLVPENFKILLEKLRQTIKALVPEVEETISWGMPAFKYNGLLLYFAAFKNHCSLFPGNSKLILQLKDELKDFKTSKGTIHFTIENPLPDELVKKIVLTRVEENINKKKNKSKDK
ncbi:MAG: hypothetical protein HW421_3225 [Ignavibacteria bacterium]|nr:hypothetical protein [Ignavibacteria bacterium]